MIDIKNSRSMLFMPGNNPAMIFSSDVLGADAVILDLEDSVSLDNKDAARILVKHALGFHKFKHSLVTVRINPTDSPYWQDDLKAILPMEPNAIVFPKASVEGVKMLEAFIKEFEQSQKTQYNQKLVILIESPKDMLQMEAICSFSNRIVAIGLGGEDYCTAMGIKRSKLAKELEYARFTIATFCRANGLAAIDTPFTEVSDFEGLQNDANFAYSIGFSGKFTINPRHIDTIHTCFSPSEEDIMDSIMVLHEGEKAKQRGQGVFSYKGKMVDMPILLRAKRTVEMAKAWNLLGGIDNELNI